MKKLIIIDGSQFDAVMEILDELGFEEDFSFEQSETTDRDTGLVSRRIQGYLPVDRVAVARNLHGVLSVLSPK